MPSVPKTAVNQRFLRFGQKNRCVFHITSVFMIFLGSTRITRYFLNGAGDTVYSMANGMIEIGCKLIFVFLLTNIPFIGQWGIWWTIGFTWLCTAVFALCRYKSGKWQKICTK